MKDFSKTTAAQIADEISISVTGQHIDNLDKSGKIILLEQAGQVGKEELIDVIISMLPVELRIAASDEYDRVCQTH